MRFAIALKKELKRLEVPFFVVYYYRSIEHQNKLYNTRTKKGRRVTNARGGQSPHNYGMAVDLIHCTKGYNCSDKAWKMIGTIGMEVARRLNLNIVWGGDWDGDGDIYDNELFDAAHWEIRDWRMYRTAMAELRADKIEYHLLGTDGKPTDFLNYSLLDTHLKEMKRR